MEIFKDIAYNMWNQRIGCNYREDQGLGEIILVAGENWTLQYNLVVSPTTRWDLHPSEKKKGGGVGYVNLSDKNRSKQQWIHDLLKNKISTIWAEKGHLNLLVWLFV